MEGRKAQRIVPVIDSYMSTEPFPPLSSTFASSTSIDKDGSPMSSLDEERISFRTSRRSRSRSPQIALTRAPVRSRSPIDSPNEPVWDSVHRASSGYYGGSDWATRLERCRETEFGDYKQLISKGRYDSDLMDAYRHAWIAWRRITDNLLPDPRLMPKDRATLQQLAETRRFVSEQLWNQQDLKSGEGSEDAMGLDDYLEDQLAEEGDEDRYDDGHGYYDSLVYWNGDCGDEMDHEMDDGW